MTIHTAGAPPGALAVIRGLATTPSRPAFPTVAVAFLHLVRAMISLSVGAAAQELRFPQMSFDVRQEVERIRTYAAKVAAEAQSCDANELVTLLQKTAENLENFTQSKLIALEPSRTSLNPSEHRPDPSSKT